MDQFTFLEIKSLQTALTGDHLLVGWLLMGGRLPQCLSCFLVLSLVLKETCLTFSDSCRPPRGLKANWGVRDTRAVIWALFLCTAEESEARLGHLNHRAVFPCYLHSTALTAYSQCQWSYPKWRWGLDPGCGTSQIYQCFLPSDLPLLEGGGWQLLAGAILSRVLILSLHWKTMHLAPNFSQKGRLLWIMETLDSCLWLYMQLSNVILRWRQFMYIRDTFQLYWLLSYWKEKQNKTPFTKWYSIWVCSPTHLWPWE